MEAGEARPEIVFFDVETTIPSGRAPRRVLYEFGAILVCPRKLVELRSFSTLIKPEDRSVISDATTKLKGISREAVANAARFQDVADTIYDFLDGRVWAGHNIMRFDCLRIREAFADAGRPAPRAKGIIDSLSLLQYKFGPRAGNLKMATLANYFGLGYQKHRSLEDVRMNLEVLKHCATVLFLEENYTDILSDEMPSSPPKLEMPGFSSSFQQGNASGVNLSEEKVTEQSESNGSEYFLEPHQVSTSSLTMVCDLTEWGTERTILLHKDIPLRMSSRKMKIRWNGLSKIFLPKLSFAVEPSLETCKILEVCDNLAEKFYYLECNGKSEWKSVITRETVENAIPAIWMGIPNIGAGATGTYETELYQRDSNGITKIDIDEFDKLLVYGRLVDVDYSLDIYDFKQQQAGIRLVPRRVTVDCGHNSM